MEPNTKRPKSRRRARGEGALFKRMKNGRELWVGQLDAGVDPKTGRRLRRYVTGATQAEAREKLKGLLDRKTLHVDLRAGTETLGSFSKTWLEEKTAAGCKPSTLSDYRDLLDRLVLPQLGKVKLEALSPLRVKRWHAQMRHHFALLVKAEEERRARLRAADQPVPARPIDTGARTMQKAHATLRALMADAARLRIVPFNPCGREAAEAPKHTAAKRTALEPSQVKALLAACDGHDLEGMILLALLHGLRWGEAAGLCWGAIDWKDGTVRIQRAVSENNRSGERTIGTPKTASSVRTVHLSARTLRALKKAREKLGDVIPHPEKLIFADANGAPLRRSNFHRRAWKRLRQVAGLPADLHFHDLRHSAGSLLLDQGVPLPEVTRLLGHSNSSVTLRIYTHAIAGRERLTADVMDALFPGA